MRNFSIIKIFKKYFGTKNGLNLKLPGRKPHLPMNFEE